MSTQREILSKNLQRLIAQSPNIQTDLADLCGVSKGTFNDWKSGRHYPRPEKLSLLATILGVTVQDLTSDLDEENVEYKSAYMNKEIVSIAKMLYQDPVARNLYKKISALSNTDRFVVEATIDKLTEKH